MTQERESSANAPAFVGRAAELAMLGVHLARARRTERPALFITGEAGIGKTALIDAFCNRVLAEQGQLRIARGQSVEGFGGKEAFYPVREALNGLCAGEEDAKARAVLTAAAPAWFAQSGGAAPSLSEPVRGAGGVEPERGPAADF